jgi:hypothetical protein
LLAVLLLRPAVLRALERSGEVMCAGMKEFPLT